MSGPVELIEVSPVFGPVELIEVSSVFGQVELIEVSSAIGPPGPKGDPGDPGAGGAASFVSADPSNRLRTGTDAKLYVPDDLTPDPLAYYILAKN